MPIETAIPGRPESIRLAAAWLRMSLQAGLNNCVDQVYKSRTHAESGWHGEASSGFQLRMTAAAQQADVVADDAGRLSRSFDQYADALHTAQEGMRRAREIAHQGGLTITGSTIEDPGPAPTAPQALPADGSASPQMIQYHADTVQAGQIHQLKVIAFAHAEEEASRSNYILDEAKATAENFWKDLWAKKYLHATDFTGGVAGSLIALHRSILKKEAARLLDEAKTAEARYLSSPGGSPEAKFHERMRLAKVFDAAELEAEAAATGRRLASKIPVIGWGVTAAGVGYDIHEGKPPGKAVVSGVVGTAGGILAASMVGGPVGLAAGTGVVAGIMIGLGADWAYDHAVPEDVKRKIDTGIEEVAHSGSSIF